MALPVDRKQLARAVKASAGSSDPLDRLAAAAAVQMELDALGAALVQRFVDKARDSGCSWSAVGRALGVSKQAAQQRFSPGSAPAQSSAAGTGGVVAAASALARAAGRRHVEPGDVATALLPAPSGATSLAGAALARLGIHAQPASGASRRRRAKAAAPAVPSGALDDLLLRAVDLAAGRGAPRVDTGDLLVAVSEVVPIAAPGGAPVGAGAVTAEVARLRRWGLADAVTGQAAEEQG